MEKISTRWNKEERVAICTVRLPNGSVVNGFAECHPDDIDMISEKTGCYIAERRAYVEYLRYIRDNEIKPELKALKKFYNVINQSKYYKEEDYSNQMLIRHINRLENELVEIKKEIQDEKKFLHDYITDADKVYNKIRKYRQQKNE